MHRAGRPGDPKAVIAVRQTSPRLMRLRQPAVTPDVKQHAAALLHEAREQMAQGNFDAAEKKIAEAEAIDIKWGLF